VSNRHHHTAIGASSSALAAKEMTSSARGVSMGRAGRILRTSAATITSTNAVTSHASA
jgi:hypothetical protein